MIFVTIISDLHFLIFSCIKQLYKISKTACICIVMEILYKAVFVIGRTEEVLYDFRWSTVLLESLKKRQKSSPEY